MNLRTHAAQIISGQQWRRQESPQAEVRPILHVAHAAVAHFEHVRIIPVSRAGVRLQSNLLINDCEHAVRAATPVGPLLLASPSVLNVARRAPQIAANLFAPKPRLGGAPFTDAENNGSS